MVALLVLHALRVRRELRASATWNGDRSTFALRDFAGRKVTVRASATATAPYSAGLWRPLIVVPVALLESFSPAAWRAVLAHEAAHHRRGDLWLNALQKFVLALWWWHPLVWLLDRRLSQVREECCDDAVLAEGLPAADYCATLLDIAGFATQRGRRVELTVGLGASHALAARFRQIMDLGRVRRTRLGLGGWVCLAALAALLLPGLPSRATAQNDRPEPPAAYKAAPPAVSPAAKLALAGKVVDHRNRPVGEAQVWGIAVPESRQGILLGAGRTNDRGEFRFELEADPPAGGRETEFAIVAFAGEQGVGGVAQPATLPTDPVLTLDRARRTQLEFREPSGAPAAKIHVGPTSLQLNDRWISLPNEVSAALAGVSNAQGQATVWGIGPAEYGSFLVNRIDLGEQHLTLDEKAPRTALTVTPAGRVEGRVFLPTGVTPEQLGSRLQVHTNWVPGINHTPHWLGSAEPKLGPDGRFVIPALREGPLSIRVLTDGKSPWWPDAPRDLVVNAGQTTRLEIPVVRAGLVQGQIVDRKTGAPLPDVPIYTYFDRNEYWPTSNARGEFQLYLPPSAAGFIRYSPAPPYFDPSLDSFDSRNLTAPASGATLRLPKVELERGAPLAAQVVDLEGNPARGVKVDVNWREEPRGSYRQLTATSGNDGHVAFDGVSPTAELELKAYRDQVELAVAKTHVGQAPGVLRLPAEERVVLRGRVVDTAGRPLPGIAYQIRHHVDGGPGMYAVGPAQSGLTDAEGRFVSPPRFLRQGRYEVAALREGQTIASTMRRVVDNAETVTFADLVFAIPTDAEELPEAGAAVPTEALVDLNGVVVDASGQPIPAAVVAWSQGKRMRTKADAAGRFRFPQLSPASVWLFASAEGFRFHGGHFVPSAGPAKLKLTARDAAVEPLRPRDDRLTTEQDALLRQKFGEYAATVMGGDDHSAMRDVQWMAPRVDPELARRLLADPRFDVFQTNSNDPADAGPWLQNVVRLFIVERWAADQPAEALAAAQGMSPGERFRGYLALLKAPNAKAEQRVEWLELAAADARQAADAAAKIVALATVAEQLQRAGQPERARELFREATELAQQPLGTTPPEDFAPGFLAWTLAPFDPPAATALLERVPANARDRAIGNVAHQLGAANPQESERLLALLNGNNRDQVAQRVVYRMAPVDLPRARRITASIADPPLRAHALGMMALALAASQPAAANSLLDEAYALVEGMTASGDARSNSIYSPTAVAVSLVGVAETVAPDRLEEFLWRTLALRGQATLGVVWSLFGPYGPDNRLRLSDPVLAAFVARYDREAARQILLPPDDQTLELGLAEAPHSFFRGLAAVDPTAALNAVARLPSRTDDERRRKLEAWQQVVDLLTRHGDERRTWLLERQFQLWSPDEVDF